MLDDQFKQPEDIDIAGDSYSPPTLQDVFDAIAANEKLKPTRKRDLLSSLRRFANLTHRNLDECPLDMKQIREDLDGLSTGPGKPSRKTLTNLRSGLLAAIKASKLKKVLRTAKVELSPDWQEYYRHITDKGDRHAVSRFSRYCSERGIAPTSVCNDTIDEFADMLFNASGIRKPKQVHRRTAQAWNKIAGYHPNPDLQPVELPDYRRKPTNIQPNDLQPQLAAEIEQYLEWCAVAYPFNDKSRVRALKPNTINLRRKQIFAAITALRDAGERVDDISTLAELIEPCRFKTILSERYKAVGQVPNVYNEGIAKTLLAIAKEWVKPGVDVLEELKRLFAKLPKAPSGMTEKNRALLVELSDEAIAEGLVQLPDKLLAPLRKKKKWTGRDLVAAQMAVAIDIQLRCALRMQNLISLEFDTHIKMPARPGDNGFISLRPEETKNDQSALFELPPDTIARIRFYRKIVRSVICYRGKVLFVSKFGRRKSPATLAQQMAKVVRDQLGVTITPHQFRHILAKLILDTKPGQLEEVKNLLRHRNLKTTTTFYAELDTLQSSRDHNELIDKLRKGKLGDDE